MNDEHRTLDCTNSAGPGICYGWREDVWNIIKEARFWQHQDRSHTSYEIRLSPSQNGVAWLAHAIVKIYTVQTDLISLRVCNQRVRC